jgi:hypothetical protein
MGVCRLYDANLQAFIFFQESGGDHDAAGPSTNYENFIM